MRWRPRRRGVLLGCGTAGVAAWVYLLDDGARRSLSFWYNALPIFLRYKMVQWRSRELRSTPAGLDDAAAAACYEDLHDRYADTVRYHTHRLRGFYLKNAQFLSMRDDFIPERYLRWMKRTQDAAPSPLAPGEARRIVEVELGAPVGDVFASFDDEPCGVASIGQVHAAVLRASGRRVAVKVQHYDAEEQFRGDIATIKSFCRLARPQDVPAFDEIERQFVTEFDYRGEAANLAAVADAVMPVYGDRVCIPRPHPDLCTRRVLVMDFVEGAKLVDGVRAAWARVGRRLGVSPAELEERQAAALRGGPEAAARARRELDKWMRAVRARDALANALVWLWNATPLRLLTGRLDYRDTTEPPDLSAVFRLLADVHGYQLFAAGAFNGDPHPGNILVMPDGRLGLIDFGQVKRMTPAERGPYAKMIIALAADARAEVARVVFDEMGACSRYRDADVAWRLCAFWNDRDTDDVVSPEGRRLNINDFVEWCQAKDPVEQFADSVIMAGRMSCMLRGAALAFGVQLRMAPLFRPHAEQFLEGQGVRYDPSDGAPARAA